MIIYVCMFTGIHTICRFRKPLFFFGIWLLEVYCIVLLYNIKCIYIIIVIIFERNARHNHDSSWQGFHQLSPPYAALRQNFPSQVSQGSGL